MSSRPEIPELVSVAAAHAVLVTVRRLGVGITRGGRTLRASLFDLRELRLYHDAWMTMPNPVPELRPGTVSRCGVSVNLDAHLPGHMAAQLAGVSRQLVNWWRRSGLLPIAATDGSGRPLYRAGDVLEVERRTRRSPYSHRRASAA